MDDGSRFASFAFLPHTKYDCGVELCWFPALALICSFRSAAEWCLVRFLDLRDGRTAEAAQFVYE